METEEVLKQFEEMGCDFIQGYYFSKAISKNDFVNYIKDSQQKVVKNAE